MVYRPVKCVRRKDGAGENGYRSCVVINIVNSIGAARRREKCGHGVQSPKSVSARLPELTKLATDLSYVHERMCSTSGSFFAA